MSSNPQASPSAGDNIGLLDADQGKLGEAEKMSVVAGYQKAIEAF